MQALLSKMLELWGEDLFLCRMFLAVTRAGVNVSDA